MVGLTRSVVAATALLVVSMTPPVWASTVDPGASEVSELTFPRWGSIKASSPAAGPTVYFSAADPDGLHSVAVRWCHEERADVCLAPVWEAGAESVTSVVHQMAQADAPTDSPLGDYVLTDVTVTDRAGHVTTLVPGGTTMVDGVPSTSPHELDLTSTLTVLDEEAPVLEGVSWTEGKDWAVVGGDDSVALDVHLTDNWRDDVQVRVVLRDEAQNQLGLYGVQEAVDGSAQDVRVRAETRLDDQDRDSGDYRVSHVRLTDGAGNVAYYRPDGTVVLDEYGEPDTMEEHGVDLAGLHLEVRNEQPGLRWPTALGEAALRVDWAPAIAADGAAPTTYTVRLAPLEPLGTAGWDWTGSDLPDRVVTLGGDATSAVVEGLDSGRKYRVTVVADFQDGPVPSVTLESIAWPTVQYSPSVTVPEGDDGDSLAVVTARLSSPSLIDAPQWISVLLHDGTASPDDFREEVIGSLTVPAGETTATLAVPVTGDTRDEEDETFLLHAHLVYGPAQDVMRPVVTIVDDDPAPGGPLSIGSTTVPGVGEGSTVGVVTVRLARRHQAPVSVRYRTVRRSADPGVDYVPVKGRIRFAPGEVTKTIRVPVLESGSRSDSAFLVRLGDPAGARISQGTGKVRIDRS